MTFLISKYKLDGNNEPVISITVSIPMKYTHKIRILFQEGGQGDYESPSGGFDVVTPLHYPNGPRTQIIGFQGPNTTNILVNIIVLALLFGSLDP